MKSAWDVKRLESVSSIDYGYTEGATSEPVGPRFLRITDIQNNHVDWELVPYCRIDPSLFKRYRLASGDIVFARTGATTGKSFLVIDPPNAVFASYLIRLRVQDESLSPKFVSYFFQTTRYWKAIIDGSTGSAQGGFNASKLGALSIHVPSLPEQKRIVAILDEAFAGMAIAKANTEKNLQNARDIFESYLSDVFTRRGEGWVEKRLDEVCVIGDGNHSSNYPKREELVAKGVPFIRATNLVAGEISDDDMRFLSPEKHAQLKKGHLKTGDILFTNRGEIGKTAIVDAGHDGSNLNSQIAWLRCKYTLNNRFLFHVLSSGAIKSYLELFKNGAALQQFTIRQIKELSIPMPPLDQQEALVVRLDGLSETTQRLARIYERKLVALEALKKSLLHQAFSGEL